MVCRISELQNKQVICVADGAFLGFIGDAEIDTLSGKIKSVIVLGKPKALGLLGREDDLVIPFEEIAVIGADTILVDCNSVPGALTLANNNKNNKNSQMP